MVKTLAELAILNMPVRDIMYPNRRVQTHLRDQYIISDIIFRHGKGIFISELMHRDEVYGHQWIRSNRHFCQLSAGPSEDTCWCACDINLATCKCSCFHCFFLLIDQITWEYGDINRNAKLKLVLARAN